MDFRIEELEEVTPKHPALPCDGLKFYIPE